MPPRKKTIRKSNKRRKKLSLDTSNVVIVKHTVEEETLFPEKLKKINKMLENAKLMD